MSAMTVGYLYPTRSSELPVIKRNRLHLFKTITGTEHEAADAKRFELSRKEFVMLALMYQTNFYHAVNIVDMVLKYGALYVFGTIILVELVVSMPMLMLFIFMSSYCKKGFIRFWDCVPMAAGIGYTTLLARLVYAMIHMVFAAVALLFIVDLMSKDNLVAEVASCSFDTHDQQSCVAAYPSEALNYTCPTSTFYLRKPNETFYISTQFYIRIMLMKYDKYSKGIPGTVDINLMLAVMFLWIVVFAVSMFGVRRVAHPSLRIQCLCYVVMGLSLFSAVAFCGDPIVPRSVLTVPNGFEFVLSMTQYSANTFVISDVMWVGTMKPKSMTAIGAALVIGILKLLVILFVVLCSERSIQLTRGHYRFADPRCLIIADDDVFMSFIPDILLRYQFGIVCAVLWYLAVVYTNTNIAIYTIMSLVSSLTERFDALSRFRLITFLSICIFSFLCNISLCTELSIAFMWTFRTYGLTFLATIVLALTNLTLLFIYTSKRIVDDYSFTYGRPPTQFWITTWRTTPIVVMFSFIYMICEFKINREKNAGDIVIIMSSYVEAILFLIPVVVIFLSKTCRHIKHRRLSTITRPSEAWGPYDNVKRQTRRFFFPQRDVRYRNNVMQCPHKCIANSGKFYEENRKQTTKMHNLLNLIDTKKPNINPILKKFKELESRRPVS